MDKAVDVPMDIPARVRAAYERLAEAGRPDIWITLREADDVLTEAKSLAERVLDGEPLPLAGALASGR
jgi:allophanate hydrolase